jgi:hypothetical protein
MRSNMNAMFDRDRILSHLGIGKSQYAKKSKTRTKNFISFKVNDATMRNLNHDQCY